MITENLISPIKHVNAFIIEDLSAELAELSEEDLQQISGGCDCCCGGSGGDTIILTYPDGTKFQIPVPRPPQKQTNSLSW
jgi:bacteriocin-like protein